MSDGKDEDEIVAPASVEIFNPVNENKEEAVEIQNPKATEITTPTLTGAPQMGIPQLSTQSLDSSDYKFVTGPDGQMIAIAKAKFEQRDFYIGAGIPMLLYFLPILALAIISPFTEDGYSDHELILDREDGTSSFSAEFQVESSVHVDHCYVLVVPDDASDNPTVRYPCDAYGKNLTIFEREYDNGDLLEIGEWNNSAGIITFGPLNESETGDIATVIFEYGIVDEDKEVGEDLEMLVGDTIGFTCCIGFIVSLVMIVTGFSQSKPGMGWGGVLGLCSLPVAGFFAMLVWA